MEPDNDEGRLVAKVAGAEDPDFSEVKPEIENTYDKDAKAVVPDIAITKELTGDDRPLNKDEFKFTLTGNKPAPDDGSYKNA